MVHPVFFQASVALSPLLYHPAETYHTMLLNRQSLRSSFSSVQNCTAPSTDPVPFLKARLILVSKRRATFFRCTLRFEKSMVGLAKRYEHAVLAVLCACAQWNAFTIDWTDNQMSATVVYRSDEHLVCMARSRPCRLSVKLEQLAAVSGASPEIVESCF